MLTKYISVCGDKFMEIIIYCLGTIGMTHILVSSEMPLIMWFRESVLKKLPGKWSTIANCYVCMGFWCGLVCGYIAFPNISWMQLFLTGCASSFLSQWGAIYLNYLEATTFLNITGDDEQKEG